MANGGCERGADTEQSTTTGKAATATASPTLAELQHNCQKASAIATVFCLVMVMPLPWSRYNFIHTSRRATCNYHHWKPSSECNHHMQLPPLQTKTLPPLPTPRQPPLPPTLQPPIQPPLPTPHHCHPTQSHLPRGKRCSTAILTRKTPPL